MLVCSTCGAATAGDLQSCMRDRPAQCRFEPLPLQRAAQPLFGLACAFVGVAVAAAITAVLFVSPAQAAGFEAALQAVALIGIYTFVYSIASIFIGLGALLGLYRQMELRERDGGRFLQVASLLGRTLSVRVSDVDAPVSLPELTAASSVPASVAALYDVVSDAPRERPSDSLAERVERLSRSSDRMVEECFEAALLSLVAQGAVRIRPARVRISSPWLPSRATPETAVHLLEPGTNPAVSGALESLVLERIRAWPTQQQGDGPFATAAELVRSFKDSEGDFSARQILRPVEEEAVEQGWFQPRPRLSTKRLLPEPSPAGGATVADASQDWMRVRQEVRDREPRVLDEIEREIRSVLGSRKAPRTALESAQSRLRVSLLKRLVLVSAGLATAVTLLSRLV
jgi:hypothetical protein